ncbi:hypothetical protein [Prochlorococcus marinus]|nr:hypothetical protein [Prochlorococcus marinus]
MPRWLLAREYAYIKIVRDAVNALEHQMVLMDASLLQKGFTKVEGLLA